MSNLGDLRICWAKALLAGGDCCGLCEHWEFTTQAQGGAPAVGDCWQAWEATMRTATAKPCSHYRRDELIERLARTGRTEATA